MGGMNRRFWAFMRLCGDRQQLDMGRMLDSGGSLETDRARSGPRARGGGPRDLCPMKHNGSHPPTHPQSQEHRHLHITPALTVPCPPNRPPPSHESPGGLLRSNSLSKRRHPHPFPGRTAYICRAVERWRMAAESEGPRPAASVQVHLPTLWPGACPFTPQPLLLRL